MRRYIRTVESLITSPNTIDSYADQKKTVLGRNKNIQMKKKEVETLFSL